MTNWGSVGVAVVKKSTYGVPSPEGQARVDYGNVAAPLGGLPRYSDWGWFALAAKGQWGATSGHRVDWVNDTIKMALLDTEPNQDTAEFWSDVSAHEVSGSGYTAGGNALTTKSLSYASSTQAVSFIADDVAWTGLSVSNVRWVVVYKDTGTAGTSPLMAYLDLGTKLSPSGQDFTVGYNAAPLTAVV